MNLSDQCRKEAETGISHRTARKLGALFAGVLPSTPELTRAYGCRVSEISQSLDHNPKGNISDGPFVSHIGADGKAIWAAATSGPNAIPILMLTSMLARIWSPPEATSLWVELVEHRRRDIQERYMNDEAALFAMQQDISRSQLADWDASARAWLRTADAARKSQQTQLMLVLNNLQLAVSNNMNVYQSVVESSKTALSSMEKLLNGQPHRAQDGAFLLGLSAWHLYPDMVVHGSVTKKIDQRDELFPAGSIITLGLESHKGIDKGIYWSLPLAHLRYYGDPVVASRSTGHEASRVSMEQLVFVALGSLFTGWVERSQKIPLALSWFSNLMTSYQRANKDLHSRSREGKQQNPAQALLQGSGWLKMLMSTAISIRNMRDHEKELSFKLVALGYRRFEDFLANPKMCTVPYFGLLEPASLLALLKDDNERINALRRHAQNLNLEGAKVIIRYKPTDHGGASLDPEKYRKSLASHQIVPNENDTIVASNADALYFSAYEYASVFPMTRITKTDTAPQTSDQGLRHKRWIAARWIDTGRSSIINDQAAGIDRRLLSCLNTASSAVCKCMDGCKPDCTCGNFFDGCVLGCHCYSQMEGCNLEHAETRRAVMKERISTVNSFGEDCIEDYPRSFLDYYCHSSSAGGLKNDSYDTIGGLKNDAYDRIKRNFAHTWHTGGDARHEVWGLRNAPLCSEKHINSRHGGPVGLRLIIGDDQTAALYLVDDDLFVSLEKPVRRKSFTVQDMNEMLQNDEVDVTRLTRYFIGLDWPYRNIISSLKALASAQDLYNHLPDATVALSVASRSLYRSSWVQRQIELDPESTSNQWLYELSLSEAFSCLAMFESGSFDILPQTLEHVFAMSSGNSLFVAAPLLMDPYRGEGASRIKRVIGNIGRAGIAMLIPPQDPQIRTPKIENWELVSHAPFNGQSVDSFGNTTHHLSFTQYTMPCDIGKHGAQDIEAYFIESLISVHDREKWVADIDVLATLKAKIFSKLVGKIEGCTHAGGSLPANALVAIDNWEELLDRERTPVVVRAFGNPVARLATAAVSVKQGFKTVLVPEEICWSCAANAGFGAAVTFIQ